MKESGFLENESELESNNLYNNYNGNGNGNGNNNDEDDQNYGQPKVSTEMEEDDYNPSENSENSNNSDNFDIEQPRILSKRLRGESEAEKLKEEYTGIIL